jgi:hypothetical protein
MFGIGLPRSGDAGRFARELWTMHGHVPVNAIVDGHLRARGASVVGTHDTPKGLRGRATSTVPPGAGAHGSSTAWEPENQARCGWEGESIDA